MKDLKYLYDKFEKANMDIRSSWVKDMKQLDKITSTGLVYFFMCERGSVFTSDTTGKQYNLDITIAGFTCEFSVGYWVTPRIVLECISKMMKYEPIKNRIQLEINDNKKCGRCDGYGYIPGFEHMYNGICFDCGGVGYKLPKIIVK